ncbi:MAG: glucose/galactose MFS transporter [Actinobacteria bacterium TMED172]|nr:glucose/galactose MFS transporter [Cellvibrionales bacterium]OUW33282.1 MAG: glucose/galactose MFS transporter [Actinobacteria bacterium TMED172]
MSQSNGISNILASFKQGSRELYIISFIFFMWGLLSCLNDLLVPYLRGVFDLNYTQAMMVQFSFFSAYFLFSIPLGLLINRIGYQKGIVLGLLISAVGCVMFLPAAQLPSYTAFLLALFVIATGVCCLQVSANPYVTSMGPEETAANRLNLTQGFNSLGTTVAPFIASIFIFSAFTELSPSAKEVQAPYLVIALLLVLLALFLSRFDLPTTTYSSLSNVEFDENKQSVNLKSMVSLLCKHRHLMYGVLGIFFYVGVEVSIGSLLVNFIADPTIGNMSEASASQYVVIFWAGAMFGRFLGFYLMFHVAPNVLLTFNTALASVLILLSVFTTGQLAMWSILLVGLCHSIMFPTVFSLAIIKLGAATPQASGILCLAIIGGAVIPIFQGLLADTVGLQMSLILALVSYTYIAFFAVYGYKPTNNLIKEQSV